MGPELLGREQRERERAEREAPLRLSARSEEAEGWGTQPCRHFRLEEQGVSRAPASTLATQTWPERSRTQL